MKKLIAALLAVLYLGSSTGAMIHLHYCMGRLANWSLGNKESRICSSCGMDSGDTKQKGCCRDEHKFVKNGTDQKVVERSLQTFKAFGIALPQAVGTLASIIVPLKKSGIPENNAPPRWPGAGIYLLNRALLI